MVEACKQERPCVVETWTPTGAIQCDEDDLLREYKSNCGTTKWEVYGAVTWQETGDTRCVGHIVSVKETNDCGQIRWRNTGAPCGYSPSVMISGSSAGPCSDCVISYGFHPLEARDPEATVEMQNCAGEPLAYIYPNAATGRTVRIETCDGVLVGYAVNRSNTAPENCAGNNPQPQ